MKSAVILVMLAFAFIANSDGIQITTWGVITSNDFRNETIVVHPQSGLILNRNFTFTVVSNWDPIGKIKFMPEYFMFQNGPIRGLRHIDWQSTYRRVRASIVAGGIGLNTVTVNLVSQRSYGYNSSLNFFG